MKWHIFYRIFSVKIVGSVKSWKEKKTNILVLQERSQIYWLISQISNQILLTMLQTIAVEGQFQDINVQYQNLNRRNCRNPNKLV